MAAAEHCRFCFEGSEVNNPLIIPCKCKGSIKYVHKNCLLKWRAATTNYNWIRKCQLCLEDYEILLRYPKEETPIQVPLLNIIAKPQYIAALSRYYFFGLMFIVCTSLVNKQPDLRLLNYLLITNYLVYLSMLLLITILYGTIYYYSFWKHIKNKKLYVYLWISYVSDDGILKTPLMTILMLIISGIFTTVCISPFAFMYIYMLAYVYNTHMSIIKYINANAELY